VEMSVLIVSFALTVPTGGSTQHVFTSIAVHVVHSTEPRL
jgi:hypothetical protein